ncbi:MAG TPA: DoxX family protein [Ktedonobacteraceae bacterium]|nr:DoxX family protein [Ktedonobacteraceae bacterium]
MKRAMVEKWRMPVISRGMESSKRGKKAGIVKSVGLLVLRLGVGGLIAGHGSQKLFGWFSGPGLKKTAGWLESLGLKPGTSWATVASTSEFGGGILTTLGLFHPLGPLGVMGAMIMATAKAHWGKPIWATRGGAELPLTNMMAALTLILTGPGRFSLDRLFGIRLPRWLVIAIAAIEAVMLVIGVKSRPKPVSVSTTDQSGKPTATPVATS